MMGLFESLLALELKGLDTGGEFGEISLMPTQFLYKEKSEEYFSIKF